jgi:putative ABC transport system ATP-binding protein
MSNLEGGCRGPQILAAGLRMRFGSGPAAVCALDGIDLHIRGGQFVCVLGPSGSGKSTLLHLLAGLRRPTEGSVRVGDIDVHALTLDQAAVWRRRNVGLVHQFFNLLPTLSVVQNVATPLLLDGWRLRHVTDRVDALLDRLGMLHRKSHPLDQLSGGELQRVAIARALIAEPGLLLGDEPTGNLDSRNGGEVLGLFREMAAERGTTTILMTHDVSATSYADRVITLRDGRIELDSGEARSEARSEARGS